jgi:hypothetical protein
MTYGVGMEELYSKMVDITLDSGRTIEEMDTAKLSGLIRKPTSS